jgi:hypothetical protein
MEAFSQRYGFQFVCHALDHPNRKAGNERSFWSVETSFLPGRVFASLEDLNAQARQWATERMEQRVLTKARVIPAQLFEHERLYLNPLSPHLPAPYQMHQVTDQYATWPSAPTTMGSGRRETRRCRCGSLRSFDYAVWPSIRCRLTDSPPHYSPHEPTSASTQEGRRGQLEEQHLRWDDVGVARLCLSVPGVQRIDSRRCARRKLTSDVFRSGSGPTVTVNNGHAPRIAWLCPAEESAPSRRWTSASGPLTRRLDPDPTSPCMTS